VLLLLLLLLVDDVPFAFDLDDPLPNKRLINDDDGTDVGDGAGSFEDDPLDIIIGVGGRAAIVLLELDENERDGARLPLPVTDVDDDFGDGNAVAFLLPVDDDDIGVVVEDVPLLSE
jgi:hypothetical protein